MSVTTGLSMKMMKEREMCFPFPTPNALVLQGGVSVHPGRFDPLELFCPLQGEGPGDTWPVPLETPLEVAGPAKKAQVETGAQPEGLWHPNPQKRSQEKPTPKKPRGP